MAAKSLNGCLREWTIRPFLAPRPLREGPWYCCDGIPSMRPQLVAGGCERLPITPSLACFVTR